jgi:peptidoglycan LD-endopeptidase LytH
VPLLRIRAVVLGLVLLATGVTGCSADAGSSADAGRQPIMAAQAGDADAPVSPSAPASGEPSSAAPKATVKHAFPVLGRYSYGHSHHDYPATDIIAACGNKIVSPVSGTVLAVVRVDTWTAKANLGATRGGLSVSILGDDGVRYYGSHYRVILDRIQPGARVTAGDQLGEVGDTGDASACHLHFGISPPCARTGDWWLQRGAIWPWSYLDSWRTGGNKSPVAEVAAWQQKNGCPTKPLVDP